MLKQGLNSSKVLNSELLSDKKHGFAVAENVIIKWLKTKVAFVSMRWPMEMEIILKINTKVIDVQ